jgi:DNA-binding NtrC family response regulator
VTDHIWLLEENEDNCEVTIELLARHGVTTTAFRSPLALLCHMSRLKPVSPVPAWLLVDAVTARGFENALAEIAGTRIVVLTTWPGQMASWPRLRAPRFMPKPFDVEALLEQLSMSRLRSECDVQPRETTAVRPSTRMKAVAALAAFTLR